MLNYNIFYKNINIFMKFEFIINNLIIYKILLLKIYIKFKDLMEQKNTQNN